MAIYYDNEDGRRIFVGDRVLCEGRRGKIVFIIEEGEFLMPDRKEDWDHLSAGIGVRWENGQLFLLDEPDEHLIPLEPEASQAD